MNKVTLSRFEALVADYILEVAPSLIIVPQARVIKRTKKTRYEIDLYLPELALGFEVQDFASHTRVESKAKNPWGSKMKGPAYHETKRKLAKAQLAVELIDLWEDDILSGAFKIIVDEALSRFDFGPLNG